MRLMSSSLQVPGDVAAGRWTFCMDGWMELELELELELLFYSTTTT